MATATDHETQPVPHPTAPLDPAPTEEDRAWWAEHCDHSSWPLDSELSPEEQCHEALTVSEIEYHLG